MICTDVLLLVLFMNLFLSSFKIAKCALPHKTKIFHLIHFFSIGLWGKVYYYQIYSRPINEYDVCNIVIFHVESKIHFKISLIKLWPNNTATIVFVIPFNAYIYTGDVFHQSFFEESSAPLGTGSAFGLGMFYGQRH